MRQSQRRYLNGADWLLTGLNGLSQRLARAGNHFQIVVELEGSPDLESFRRDVRRYCAARPVLSGRVRRAWNLAPYWQPAGKPDAGNPQVAFAGLPKGLSPVAEARALADHLNAPCSAPVDGLAFSALARENGNTWLVCHFDHRLFDAPGAEQFLHGFGDFLAGRASPNSADRKPHPLPANLRPWKDKFASGRQVNRLRIGQQALAPFQLPCRPTAGPARFHFSRIVLPPDEAGELIARAYRQAGYLMLTPYLAAQAMRALKRLTDQRDKPLSGYVAPCTASLPRTDDTFFNHLSFVCLAAAADDLAATDFARQLSKQFYRQIEDGMPAHFENVWKLLRIVPAAALGRLLGGPMRTFLGSFCLAYVGDGLSRLADFAGLLVCDAFHMPSVPPVPGVGFFANGFRGQFNLCLTSFNGVLSENEHDALAAELRRLLNPLKTPIEKDSTSCRPVSRTRNATGEQPSDHPKDSLPDASQC